MKLLNKFLVWLILLTSIAIIGCDESDPVYYYNVFRENSDGSHTLWTTQKEPKIVGSFLCWEESGATTMCVSGKLTLKSHQMELD